MMMFMLMFASGVSALEGLRVGLRAPSFTASDLHGNRLTLADFRDSKVIVVTFFATWSESSPELLGRLEKLWQQYERIGLTVVGLNVESQRIPPAEEEQVRRLVQDLGISFPILIDRGLEAFHRYGVIAVPSTVVIDKTGTVVGELVGYPLALREDLFDLIETQVTGKKRAQKVQKTGHQPQPKAVRYYNLARALVARGSMDMAEVNLQRAIESDAKFALPVILLGQIYKGRAGTDENVEFAGQVYTTAFFSETERQRFVTEAEALFRRALAVDQDNTTALTELGSLQSRQGHEAEGEKLLRQALAINASYTPAHCFLGELLLKQGKVQQAKKIFKTATKLNPLDYKCYLIFAQAYEAKGLKKEAVDLYKKGLERILSSRQEGFPISFKK